MKILRRGSLPFIALERVHVLGGVASTKQLMRALPGNFTSTTRVDREAIKPLISFGYVVSVKAGVQITQAGMEFLKANAGPDSTAVPAVQHTTMRPLSQANQLKPPYRPGSFDYRSIPSMMGDTRVPYHGATVTDSDEAN